MKIVFLLLVILNLCLVFCQRNLDFGLMLTLEDLIVGQIHWNEKYKCSCFSNIDDVPSQGSPVMRNDTAMMYYLSHHHVICDMHIPQSIIFSNTKQIIIQSEREKSFYFHLLFMHVKSIIIWRGYIFTGKSEKFDFLMQGNYWQHPYLRLRLETLLARLAKLANEILEARWKDIQRKKLCK